MRKYVFALAGLLLLGLMVVGGFYIFDTGAHKEVDIKALFDENGEAIPLAMDPYVVPIMKDGRPVAYRTYRLEVVVNGEYGRKAFDSAKPRIRDVYVRHLFDLTAGPVALASGGRADPRAVEQRLFAASQLALGEKVVKAVNVLEVSDTRLP